ncbi:MAG: hypothetical protein AAB074_01185 [Planctomycetota bacterium]
MRRWIAVFLAAFIPPTAVMVFFAWRAQAPRGNGDDSPLVTISKKGLPIGTARGVAIVVYEGDRMVAEITGAEAQIEGRDRAVFTDAVIRAWPEKSDNPRQPEEVTIRARRAEIDREGFVARVIGNVLVATPEGDTLRAEDLKILFGKRIQQEDGKEIVDRSEKTIDSRGPVELASGDSVLRGTGFHGNLALKSFRFDRAVSGTFFGTSADFAATAASRTSRKPEDVTFHAGGPVTGEPLESEGKTRRTRLVMAGGVEVLRIDAETEKPTRMRCGTATADIRRRTPPPPAWFPAWEASEALARSMGMELQKPAEVAAIRPPHPRVSLERLLAEGGVAVQDPRVNLEAESLETVNAEDGSGVTTLRGPKKRLEFHDRGAMSLGPMGDAGAGPKEVTAMDDIRIVRAADGADGEPGPATIGLSRWVWVREGARELTCDSMRLDLAPDAAPATGGKKSGFGYAPSSLAATGNVIVKEPGQSARADTLSWNAAEDTVTLLSDAGAEVVLPDKRLVAKKILFDNKTSRITCRGNVVASGEGGGFVPTSLIELNTESGASGGPWELRCPEFTGVMTKEQECLDAMGPVTLTTDTTTAAGDALHYEKNHVVLTGRPARIVSGKDIVEAWEIALAPDTGRAVLRGVKEIRFHMNGGLGGLAGLAPSRPATAGGDAEAPTPVILTCSGPVVIDRDAGMFIARDCVLVRSPESAAVPGKPPPPLARLEADRVWIHFEPQTRELLGAIATGRVRLRSSSLIAAGDRLTYDVPTGTAAFTGIGKPLFANARDGSSVRVDEVQVADGGRTLKFLARHSKGSISFPEGPAQDRPGNFLQNPFGNLKPKPKKDPPADKPPK